MDIRVTFDGLESSQAFTDYLTEKIGKHKKLLDSATSIDVVFRLHVHAKGVKNDYGVNISVSMPRKVVRVEEKAEEMYKAIDMAEDTLFRRLKKYHSFKQKKIVRPWKNRQD